MDAATTALWLVPLDMDTIWQCRSWQNQSGRFHPGQRQNHAGQQQQGISSTRHITSEHNSSTGINPFTQGYLELSFDKPPKSKSLGFTFGRSPECDIVLGDHHGSTISRFHFRITFNEQRRVLLRDDSTLGTTVSYDNISGTRRKFHWLLSAKLDTRVEIHLSGFHFLVVLPNPRLITPEALRDRYKAIDPYLKSSLGMDLVFSGMAILTPTALPSEAGSPCDSKPMYIPEDCIGSGGFGYVEKVICASTGSQYARKLFPANILTAIMRDEIKKEVNFMRNTIHERIIPIVDACFERGTAFIVMPLFDYGNLAQRLEQDMMTGSPLFSERAAGALIEQTLDALRFIHHKNITHRDIKPENILIKGISPWEFVLCDFGIGSNQHSMKTRMGTRAYMAPEMIKATFGHTYHCSVDIWALGLVFLHAVYDPFNAVFHEVAANFGDSEWYNQIVNVAKSLGQDNLLDMIRTGMLRKDPNSRWSAKQCYDKSSRLDLWHDRNGNFPFKVRRHVRAAGHSGHGHGTQAGARQRKGPTMMDWQHSSTLVESGSKSHGQRDHALVQQPQHQYPLYQQPQYQHPQFPQPPRQNLHYQPQFQQGQSQYHQYQRPQDPSYQSDLSTYRQRPSQQTPYPPSPKIVQTGYSHCGITDQMGRMRIQG